MALALCIHTFAFCFAALVAGRIYLWACHQPGADPRALRRVGWAFAGLFLAAFWGKFLFRRGATPVLLRGTPETQYLLAVLDVLILAALPTMGLGFVLQTYFKGRHLRTKSEVTSARLRYLDMKHDGSDEDLRYEDLEYALGHECRVISGDNTGFSFIDFHALPTISGLLTPTIYFPTSLLDLDDGVHVMPLAAHQAHLLNLGWVPLQVASTLLLLGGPFLWFFVRGLHHCTEHLADLRTLHAAEMDPATFIASLKASEQQLASGKGWGASSARKDLRARIYQLEGQPANRGTVVSLAGSLTTFAAVALLSFAVGPVSARAIKGTVNLDPPEYATATSTDPSIKVRAIPQSGISGLRIDTRTARRDFVRIDLSFQEHGNTHLELTALAVRGRNTPPFPLPSYYIEKGGETVAGGVLARAHITYARHYGIEEGQHGYRFILSPDCVPWDFGKPMLIVPRGWLVELKNLRLTSGPVPSQTPEELQSQVTTHVRYGKALGGLGPKLTFQEVVHWTPDQIRPTEP